MAAFSPESPGSPLEELSRVASATSSLISQLQPSLSDLAADSSAKKPATQDDKINALNLAQDSVTLIKAHSTKISLLIINEPFTPTAICKVLRELTGGPLPALASAVELCDPNRYTRTVRRDLAWRSLKVLKDLGDLVGKIPADGKALTGDKKSGPGGGAAGAKGSIPVTGQLWAACDSVVDLTKLGVSGYLVQKAEQFRDTLQDVLEELIEWRDEHDEVDDDDADDDTVDDDGTNEDDSNAVNGVADQLDSTHISDTQEIIDELMNASQHIPAGDPDKIRPRLDDSISKLRLTTHFLKALIKRRLKTLPTLPPSSPSDIPRRLNQLFDLLKELPDRSGNVAMAFYELDSDAIDQAMNECFLRASLSSGILQDTWSGQSDEFSGWVLKFQGQLPRPP